MRFVFARFALVRIAPERLQWERSIEKRLQLVKSAFDKLLPFRVVSVRSMLVRLTFVRLALDRLQFPVRLS